MSLHVRVPTPLMLVDVHLAGTWPQLRRQEISGVGTPTASQTSTRLSPGFNLTFDGAGGRVTCTGAGGAKASKIFAYGTTKAS